MSHLACWKWFLVTDLFLQVDHLMENRGVYASWLTNRLQVQLPCSVNWWDCSVKLSIVYLPKYPETGFQKIPFHVSVFQIHIVLQFLPLSLHFIFSLYSFLQIIVKQRNIQYLSLRGHNSHVPCLSENGN